MIALAAELIPVHAWISNVSQAATGSLVAAIWQGILLTAAAGLGLRLLSKTPAAVRFAVWFGVFLLVVALPIISLMPHGSSGSQSGTHSLWFILDARWTLVIAALWLAAALIRASTLAVAAFRVRDLWKRATPVQTASNHAPKVDNMAGRRAQLCTSDEVDRPTVIGFFSPKILIPTWLLEKLTPAELEQIVLHESGHLGRADDWMNLLQKIALVVFPLNPALAWVERRLCFERELAVDERVLSAFAGKPGAAKAYASCLATLAEYRLGRRGFTLALGALGRESELAQRVGRILRRGERMRPLHARLVLGGAMLGLVGGAVGLERCPQLVGFAASPDQNAAVNIPANPRLSTHAAPGSAYRYQAVVFRPDEVHRATPLQQKLGARVRVPVRHAAPAWMAAQNKPIPLSEPTHDAAPEAVAVSAVSTDRIVNQSRASERMVQWVEVRSWVGADGSRVVLTTSTTTTRATGQATPAQVSDEAQPQPSQQVHPYAAVPVRGGWLVFQL